MSSPESKSPADTATLVDHLAGACASVGLSPTAHGPLEGYEVLGVLGRGGMGVVYKARDLRLRRLVAIKMILAGDGASSGELVRFRTEAEATAALQHPNIVQIFEVKETAGTPYLVLEYVDGASLAHTMGGKPQAPALAATRVKTLARAMQFAHEQGFLHRDLKPANILLASGAPESSDAAAATRSEPASSAERPVLGEVLKIADFGLAKQIGSDQGQTQTGAVLGTPSYMAPEQAWGKSTSQPIGPAADIYALGAILYESLTGRPPFQGENALDTLEQVWSCEPVPPSKLVPTVPRDLETICLKCLEKEPSRRYVTAKALGDDLHRFLRGQSVLARRPTLRYRLEKWARRHTRLLRFAAAGCVLALLGYLALADGNFPVPGGESLRRGFDSLGFSMFRPVPQESDVAAEAARLRADMAQRFLANRRVGNWMGFQLNKGRVEDPDPWSQAQILAALAGAPETDAKSFKEVVSSFHQFFHLDEQVHFRWSPFLEGYGWQITSNEQYHSSIPASWALVALARTLRRDGLLSKEERPVFLEYVRKTQGALAAYRSLDKDGVWTGAWNFFPNQDDPSASDAYATSMALFALVELKKADLPWLNDSAARDEMIKSTAQHLLNQYAYYPLAKRWGWECVVDRDDSWSDGLTLTNYSLLLDAEREGLITLPERMVDQIDSHLDSCLARPFDFASPRGTFGRQPFRDAGGVHHEVSKSVHLLWYPWCLKCAVAWSDRLERTGAGRGAQRRARRLVGHLVLDLGGEAIQDTEGGYIYRAAENLLGWDAVNLNK